MSTTQAQSHTQPWTSDLFGPGELYGSTEPARELSPYKVTFGDEIYDQSQFTADTRHRYHNFTSGIGAGKTVAGIIRMMANVQVWNPGENGMIVTPTSMGIKNTILPELYKWGIMDTWDYYGPQSESPGLHAPNGTRILLESADNQRKIERLRGPSIAWFWIDEAALLPKKAWDILQGRMRTGEYMNAWITTTPKGFNWIYDKFHPEGEDHLGSVNNVLGVPTYANPHLPVERRQELREVYTGQFHDQEIEGAFMQPEGLVFDWFDRDSHIVTAEELPESFDEVIYGCDWGFHPHPAAMVVIGIRDGEYYVLAEHYETRNTMSDLAGVAADWYDEFGPGIMYRPPDQPALEDEFREKGVRTEMADNDVDGGISFVNQQADNFYVGEWCQATINEFGQYRYDDNGDPVKENDHAADAIRYSLYTHHSGPTPYFGSIQL